LKALGKVSVFGLGYVGLTFSVCLASRGFEVIGVDVDLERVKLVSEGVPPFYEPDLEAYLRRALSSRLLSCTTDYFEAVLNSDVSFICVGTPAKGDGSVDLSYVESASRGIGHALKEKEDSHLIVVRSTVPPGTCEGVVKRVIETASGKRCGADFGLCMNPEFLREGSAIRDFFNPDRIIIGEYDAKSGDLLENFYRSFHGDSAPPILRTSLANAELIKYANNAFLAMKVSFINEIANICQVTPGADVTVIAEALGLDHRISPEFLKAGLGWGGSCLPKDLKELIRYAESRDYDPALLRAVYEVNEFQPYKAVELARELIGDLKGRRIAVLGLAFKPNTDDMRNAVSIVIIEKLLEEGAQVVAYDPAAINNAAKLFGDRVKFAPSALDCIRGCDCCIIVTEWDEFRKLEPEDFVENMRYPALVDGRRIYDPCKFASKLKYRAVGLCACGGLSGVDGGIG